MSYEAEIIEAVQEQKATISLPRFKAAMITHLQTEIELLGSWVKRTNSGGWSTHLNYDMNKRIVKLKELHYSLVCHV